MQLNACMMRRRARLRLNPVPRWFPGRGTAFDAPPVRIFYFSKVREQAFDGLKVLMAACGNCHTLALTKVGSLWSWIMTRAENNNFNGSHIPTL